MGFHVHLSPPVCWPILVELPPVPTERELKVLRALDALCAKNDGLAEATRRQVAEKIGENRRGHPNLVGPDLNELAAKGWARRIDISNLQTWRVTPVGKWFAAEHDQRRWLVVGPAKALLINAAPGFRDALKRLVGPYRDIDDDVLRSIAAAPSDAPRKHRDAAFVAQVVLAARFSLARAS